MENEKLYPELLDYVFDYCGRYFWKDEIKAHRHLHALAKSNNGVNTMMYKVFMKEENGMKNKVIMDLISGGFAAFKIKVATRIYNEYQDKLELNICPQCGKITRTPWAKQCRFCFHDWH